MESKRFSASVEMTGKRKTASSTSTIGKGTQQKIKQGVRVFPNLKLQSFLHKVCFCSKIEHVYYRSKVSLFQQKFESS